MTSRVGTWKIAAGVGMLALIGAGCSSSGTSSSSAGAPTTGAPTTVAKPKTTPLTDARSQSASDVHVIAGSADGTSPCEEAAPTPSSPGQVGAGQGGSAAVKTAAQAEAEAHGARGKVQAVPLTAGERKVLEQQLATAKQVALAYPTVKAAEAAGYSKSTVYVPCIGAHYTNVGLAGRFDAAHPSELLYAGTDPDSKIVGLSYLVWHGGGPPPGFAGANDRWHQHNANGGLCLKGGLVVGGESSTRQECAAMGGHKTLLTDIWMVHAWVVPGITCKWGTFSGECPELGGRLGGTATDGPYPSKFS
jgi:hypothetical protein